MSTEPDQPPSLSARLAEEGVRLVVLTFVDNGGITRAKLVPLSKLERVAWGGVGMADVYAVAAVDDRFAVSHAPHFDSPSGDMRLVPDLAAVRVLAAAPGYAWAPVVQKDLELEVLDVCQRGALARIVADAARAGITLRATYELEFTLLKQDLRPVHDGPGVSPIALLPLQEFSVDLLDALEAQGIDVEQLHPEYAPGQFEVSVAPIDPLAAADRLVLMRITVRQVAARHGLLVSFAPAPLLGEMGNGCHLHLSVWRSGQNCMTGGNGHAGMQPEGSQFIAGMLDLLPGLTALVAPSVSSYIRLQPGHWAGAFTVWGIENREAALRLIPGSRTTRSAAANVELKIVDGSANPYLAMLGAIAAGLHGIANQLELPPPVQREPGALDPSARAAAGAVRLPKNVHEAIGALAAAAPLREALGPRLFEAYCGVRKAEAETFEDSMEKGVITAHRLVY